jgi:hypothetical protein
MTIKRDWGEIISSKDEVWPDKSTRLTHWRPLPEPPKEM